jgi:hypothetical protein
MVSLDVSAKLVEAIVRPDHADEQVPVVRGKRDDDAPVAGEPDA